MRRPGSMAILRPSAVSLFAIALLFSCASAVFQNDFSSYPTLAQPCLYKAANESGCDGNTVSEMNACLCGNEKSGFITLAAECLGSNSPDLSTTYSTMKTNCAGSNTPIALSQAQWDAAAASGSSTTSTASPTTTTSSGSVSTITESGTTLTTVITSTSSSPTSTGGGSGGGGGGGTNTALIGGIAGGVGGVLLVLIGVVYFVLRRRMNATAKGKDESHPMLNNPGGGNGGGPEGTAGIFGGTNANLNTPSPNPVGWVPTSTSPGITDASAGGYRDDKSEWRPVSTAWTATPSPQSAPGWGGSPGQPHSPWGQPQPYQGAGSHYHGAAELPSQTASQVYELGDTGTVQHGVEMPGSIPPQHR